MYTPNQIADFFLARTDETRGDSITPLKLQKLVYYAQAWHYTLFGEPLFEEKIEAWVNGPVVPTLYARFAGTLKNTSIDVSEIKLEPAEFPIHTQRILDEVSQIYGERSGTYLENLTHSEQPWISARGILPPFAICKNEITLDSMRSYYSQFKNEV